MVRNLARDKLERGELSLGVGIRVVRSIEIAKTMMTAGYDWLFIDLEHGAVSIETAGQIALAALDAGIAPIVRIPNGEFSIATRLLDNGAQGIVIPHVETAAEARTVVEKLRYPPQGHRGIMGSVPQFAYATMSAADMASLNVSNIIAVMLESRDAIDNAAAIAAVPGIDVLLIGANDLCLDMGMPGDFGHPQVSDAFARMIAACCAHGKWAGIGGVYDEPLMQHYVAMGVRFVLAGGDLGFLMGAARQRAKFLRGLPKPT
jgi:2-keto-3-deoxy-L-rhamnonate aldolase RhmA